MNAHTPAMRAPLVAASHAVDPAPARPVAAGSPARPGEAGYRHEAFLFRGVDELLAGTVPFVRDAVDAGEPIMVALIDAHWLPLRAALGSVAGDVHHVDMNVLGRNPARIIPAWTSFVEEHRAGGRPLRGIGEPIWAGRTGAELAECQLHEALLNVALGPRTPLWLLCPYDVDALTADVVAEARCSHPVVSDLDGGAGDGPDGTLPAPRFGGDAHVRELWESDLPTAPPRASVLPVVHGGLSAVRAAVRRAASAVGLAAARVDDLALSVNELAANSLDHGGGRGVLRLWEEAGTLVCEVTDAGRLDDVMVGRTRPAADQPRGRGVWMVNQLCDLVQIRSSAAGTVVRVHTRL